MASLVTKEAIDELEEAIRKLDKEIKGLPVEDRLAQYKKFVLDIATAKAEMTDEERAEYGITDGMIAAAKKLDKLTVGNGVVYNFGGLPFVLMSPDEPVGGDGEGSGGSDKKEKEKKKKSSGLDVLRKK